MEVRERKVGVLVGGTGLIGGTLLHHFKRAAAPGFDLLSPNSKELSLRVPGDIRSYFERVKPAFIINCAIAAIDSDPELTYEVDCLGSVYLARAACELGVPYIHLSSAAVMPHGLDVREDERLPLTADLSNYAKGKLIAERAIEHLHQTRGLDYTAIRLGVVYGAHDHKIQGFHRLLFSLVDDAMPVLLTHRESAHTYSNSEKLPDFVSHVLRHRPEFTAGTYHFVDPEPVRLGELILTIRSLLGHRRLRAIYLPYAVARGLLTILSRLVRVATKIGIEARAPAEAVFLKSFYQSQVLSSERLRRSSWVDPSPGATILNQLPALIQYYVRRWESLNLIAKRSSTAPDPRAVAQRFLYEPEVLLSAMLDQQEGPFLQQCSLVPPPADTEPEPKVAEPDRLDVEAPQEPSPWRDGSSRPCTSSAPSV